MLDINTSLYEAKDIRLGPIDYENDPEIESQWTHDCEFMRMMELKPVLPLSPEMVKKQYEQIEKENDEKKDSFYFTIRSKKNDRLIGKAVFEWVDWSNGNIFMQMGIGSYKDRNQGFGTQALGLLLRFAFAELNMFRITCVVPEYCQAAISMLRKVGFIEEVRRRQAILRDGRTWDLLVYGLLQSEWNQE